MWAQAALVEIVALDPGHPDAQHCLRQYFADLDHRLDTGFDPAAALPTLVEQMRPPAGVFLVARLHGEPIGCGALKFHDDEPAEIKRMWVATGARGRGVGRSLLTALEHRAANNGCRTIRLDTNQSLTEAIAMYRSAGYGEVDAFNDEPYAHLWFEKHLDTPVTGR